MGDLRGARALFEKVLDVCERTLPGDHNNLQVARLNLGSTLAALGDLQGARALEEKVLEVRSRTLPDDHSDVQAVRQNLAVTIKALGDLQGARALEERVLEVRSRTLPDDHPYLQMARNNLARTIWELGDLQGARALEEKEIEVLSRTRLDDNAYLQRARGNLAETLRSLGDLQGARALEEKVLEVFTRTLPDDHPELQWARRELAATMEDQGDLQGALALNEKALEVFARIFRDDQPDLQGTRACVARLRIRMGESVEAETATLLRTIVQTLQDPKKHLASRELEALAVAQADLLGWALSSSAADGSPALGDLAFAAVETVRAAAAARARLFAALDVPADVRPGMQALEERLQELSGATRLALFKQTAEGGVGTREERMFFDRVQEQDRCERELSEILMRLAREQKVAMRADRAGVAAALRPGQAAVGYWRYSLEKVDREQRTIAPPVASYLAFVVNPDGQLLRVELGPAAVIEQAVSAYRDAIGAATQRAARALSDTASQDPARAAGERLRALVLDPVLAKLPGASHLIVALDDVLHLVPLGALPLEVGLVGQRVTIELRNTLKELTVARRIPSRPPALLAMGGIEYDMSPGIPPQMQGPVARGAAHEMLGSGPWALGFGPLEETAGEVKDIAALFRKSFENADACVLQGREASCQALEPRASRARFVHLATHGYFAPESVASMKDERPIDAKLRFGRFSSLQSQVRGLAPMELCGLAFAGANLEPGQNGFVAGVLTAEQIAGSSWAAASWSCSPPATPTWASSERDRASRPCSRRSTPPARAPA
jgi:tetratricopeptide (TPR) repeat protein